MSPRPPVAHASVRVPYLFVRDLPCEFAVHPIGVLLRRDVRPPARRRAFAKWLLLYSGHPFCPASAARAARMVLVTH